jgi:hypothetical protein
VFKVRAKLPTLAGGLFTEPRIANTSAWDVR